MNLEREWGRGGTKYNMYIVEVMESNLRPRVYQVWWVSMLFNGQAGTWNYRSTVSFSGHVGVWWTVDM